LIRRRIDKSEKLLKRPKLNYRGGGRTLRNTFAVQEIKAGASNVELIEKLGLMRERSLETYTKAAKLK
jgi:hypothetical protein